MPKKGIIITEEEEEPVFDTPEGQLNINKDKRMLKTRS